MFTNFHTGDFTLCDRDGDWETATHPFSVSSIGTVFIVARIIATDQRVCCGFRALTFAVKLAVQFRSTGYGIACGNPSKDSAFANVTATVIQMTENRTEITAGE